MPERARDIVELLVAGGFGAGITGFWGWMNGRKPGEAALVAAAAQLQDALNKAAQQTVAGLRDEVEALKSEIEALKQENETCRREAAEMSAQMRAEAQARREVQQKLESLLRQLKDPHATAPGGPLHGAVIELSRSDVIVAKPARRRKS